MAKGSNGIHLNADMITLFCKVVTNTWSHEAEAIEAMRRGDGDRAPSTKGIRSKSRDGEGEEDHHEG